ncbi:MAG: MFS transporter [Spirochaetes bacterium]|nr:MFS transporter [Spirochaetota bacterium]
MTRNKQLPFRVKLGYGAAELSNSLTWTMFYVLFLFFLTDIVKMDPAFAGFIMMVGTAYDAVTDPPVGMWMDRFRSRWGRRRPFLLVVAIPFGIATWLLFTDPGLSMPWTKAYFIAVVILYFTCSDVLDIPYTSLSAEMTQDYDERTKLVSYRAVFCQIASIIGAGLPLIAVESLTSILGSRQAGWSAMTAMMGVFAVFPILWTWRATRGLELYPQKTDARVRDVFDHVLKNRTFLFTMGVYITSNVALAVSGAVMVYFMKYHMGFSDAQQSIAFVSLFACTILWVPVLTALSARLGKRGAFIATIGLWAAVQSVAAMLIVPGMDLFFYAMVVLASGGIIAVTMTGWSMIPDVIEVDEFKTGQRREGLYFGVIGFSRKVSVAVSVWLVGIVLSAVGYVPDAPQSETALLGIRLLYAEGTSIFLLASILLAYLLPMTRKKHEALREAIRLKREGSTPGTEGIEDVL